MEGIKRKGEDRCLVLESKTKFLSLQNIMVLSQPCLKKKEYVILNTLILHIKREIDQLRNYRILI